MAGRQALVLIAMVRWFEFFGAVARVELAADLSNP